MAKAAILVKSFIDSFSFRCVDLTTRDTAAKRDRLESGAPPGRPHVDRNRGDDQNALDHVLPVGGDDEDIQAVVQES